MIQFEEQREKRLKKNDQSLQDMWDHTECTNVCVTGDQKERREKKRWKTKFVETMANLPNLMKQINLHSQ